MDFKDLYEVVIRYILIIIAILILGILLCSGAVGYYIGSKNKTNQVINKNENCIHS